MKQGRLKVSMFVLAVLAAVFSGCGRTRQMTNVETGMQYIEEMKYSEALEAFEAAGEAGEDAGQILRGMGIACMGLTDYDKAIEYFLRYFEGSNGRVGSMDYDVNFYLAAAYQKMGRYGDAEEIYNAILDMDQENTDARFLRGNARLAQGRYAEACEDFDRVVELEPTNFSRLIKIYEVLASDGYRELAQGYLQTALDERAGKMSAYDKGRVNYYLGNYEQAQILLESAKVNNDAEIYYYLGMAYEATGDYNYAISNVYNTYLARGEGNAAIYNQLGLCYMKQENYEAALEAFQNAMQIEGNGMMQTLRFNEIIAYEYLGEFTQAAVLLDNYLKNYPDDEIAQREYDFLSTR